MNGRLNINNSALRPSMVGGGTLRPATSVIRPQFTVKTTNSNVNGSVVRGALTPGNVRAVRANGTVFKTVTTAQPQPVTPGATPGRKIVQLVGNPTTGFSLRVPSPALVQPFGAKLLPRAPSPMVVKKAVSSFNPAVRALSSNSLVQVSLLQEIRAVESEHFLVESENFYRLRLGLRKLLIFVSTKIIYYLRLTSRITYCTISQKISFH